MNRECWGRWTPRSYVCFLDGKRVRGLSRKAKVCPHCKRPIGRQLPLFGPELGEAKRDEGIERAIDGAGDEWAELAYRTVVELARSCDAFTSDHVWATGLAKPAEPRALGAVMMRAQREGVIEPRREFRQTAQAARHRAPVRVWRSMLHAQLRKTGKR